MERLLFSLSKQSPAPQQLPPNNAMRAALDHAPGAAPQGAWPELIVGLSQLRTPTDAEMAMLENEHARQCAAAPEY